MSLLRAIGKKQLEQGKSWIPSLSLFGATGFSALLYFTDWKLVLQYMPIYNTKFPKDEQ